MEQQDDLKDSEKHQGELDLSDGASESTHFN